jgi:hypothetical protein
MGFFPIIFAGEVKVSRVSIPGSNDPLAAGLPSWLTVMNALGQILSDERIQASRSFSSNGLLK